MADDCPPPTPVTDAARAGTPAPATGPAAPSGSVTVPGNIEVSSDSAWVNRTGDAELAGHVVVRQGERSLEADSARYRASDQSFEVEGDVAYRDPRIRLKGSAGEWTADGGRFEGTEFEIPERSARGQAERLELRRNGNLSLAGVRFTTCPANREDWRLEASQIDIDRGEQEGTGRNVRVRFKGVPILYTPWITFPVGDTRKSGFLFPTIGNSDRNGFEFSVPYYFNLAPNYDLMLTPQYYSSRGLELGADFRYLTQSSRGRLQANYLPNDSQADRDRGFARLEHQTDFLPNLRLSADLAEASDSLYFEDFGLGTEGTSVTYLERLLRLDYRGERWRLHGLVDNFQTIDQAVDPLDRPYARVPQVAVTGAWPLGGRGLQASVDGEATWFDRAAGVKGGRLDVEPRLSWPVRGAGYFIEPGASFRYTQYALDRTEPGADDAPRRSLPRASLDAGLFFDRDAGHGRVQTVEPRLLYTYIPYRNQDPIPLFDTGLPDLDLVQLFRPNRYVGADRVGDANQLAAGVTTRLIEGSSGRQLVAATLGQAFYFDEPRVALPGEQPGRTASDTVAQLSVTAYRHWNVDFGMQWDPNASNTIRSLVNVQYHGTGNRLVNVGYRYNEGRIEQWEASGAWPIQNAWQLYARRIYSLKDKAAIDTFLGVEYRSCCWRARMVARRYVSSRTGETDTSIALQLELNGLSSVGVPADAFLERSIRGYSRDPAAPLP